MVKKDDRLGVVLWFRLSRFYNRNMKLTNQNFKEAGISMAMFDVLAQIGPDGKLTQQELGRKLVVTKGNITQLLVKLETQQYVRREKVGREKFIMLTKKGIACYNELVPKQEAFQREQFSNLTREEQKQLLDLLKKLN
ncbi:MarR family winged helix-turn-helix transcriptional regulator [Listeria fleischmannii]|uniref:MarR family winged helix-turn-helix transcriptional regulator n=1 Tax=Listeria fleischmannii TaxID=1069827 RepID=UPI0016295386|nr:MarR family transcriptional regulator [Listeria fleischmannii]MBC1419170.1 MarR family transcriptional regulator [Listeria fleischmannii]